MQKEDGIISQLKISSCISCNLLVLMMSNLISQLPNKFMSILPHP